MWQKFGEGVFKENPITDVKVEGIKSSQPEASKQVYQPPNVRLMKEGRLSGNGDVEQQPIIPGLPPGYTGQKNTSSNSNRQKKSRKKKENKNSEAGSKQAAPKGANRQPQQQSQQQETDTNEQANSAGDNNSKQIKEQAKPQHRNAQKNRKNMHVSLPPTGDPEKDQKMRNIAKRLQDIAKLKTKQSKGERLEANQMAKIATENALIEELNSLKLAS